MTRGSRIKEREVERLEKLRPCGGIKCVYYIIIRKLRKDKKGRKKRDEGKGGTEKRNKKGKEKGRKGEKSGGMGKAREGMFVHMHTITLV